VQKEPGRLRPYRNNHSLANYLVNSTVGFVQIIIRKGSSQTGHYATGTVAH
jgi:hypothetical protein